MGPKDNIADTARYSLKIEAYQDNKTLFQKTGFSPSIAKKILPYAWLTVWDVYYLFRYAKRIPQNGTYLEIKSWMGASVELVYGATKLSRKQINLISIGPNIDEAFLRKTRTIPRFRSIKSHASAAKTQIKDKSVDLFFLDGARSYEFVKRDIQDYWPKLKIGGIFLGHDYSEQKEHRGVVRAANETFGWNLQKLENSRMFLIKKYQDDLWADRVDGGKKATGPRKHDIIIPYFHGQQRTCKCIQNVIEHSENYRIIATADGSRISEIKTIEQTLETTERFTHLINLVNIGFPGNTNRALKIADAKYITVINNDITVREDWLKKLEEEFLRCGKNCFIGSSGAAVSQIGGNTSSSRFPEVDYLGWSIIFSSKKCFDRVGLLDEHFSIGYYEDVDFGLRAKKLGIKSYVFSPPVSHDGGFSMNKIEPLRLGHARNINLAYLKKKWGFK